MKFRPCVPGCFAPATAARPCHGHAAAGLHGYARSRGAAASVLGVLDMPRHMSRYPPHVSLRPPVNLRTFHVLVCAAYTRTTSPLRWMHWHARCIHQDCIPAPLDALACASIRQDRICALFSTGRTGMREHTPGLRPRCAGCTGMRDAYTRTASPHRWMRWHARAYTRTASADSFFFF